MIKKGILLGAVLLSISTVNAQKGFYTGIGVGYGFSSPTDVLGTKYSIDSDGTEKESNIYGSLGAGFNSSVNVGYMFGDHFGMDLGVNYFIGSKTTINEVISPTGELNAFSKSNQLRLIPSFVMTTGGEFALYTRAGFIFPVIGTTFTESSSDFSGIQTDQHFESKGTFSIGYHGAFGAKYALNEHLSLFAEISGAYLRIKSKSTSMTKNSVNGVDFLSGMTTYQKETIYKDELNSSSNNALYNSNSNAGSAKEDLSKKTNYNGAFLNVGVKYKF